MSTESHTIPEDIMVVAEKVASSISYVIPDPAADKLAIVEAIHDAVMAERERCEAVCTDHISILRKLFQNDVARALEQVRAEIKVV